MSLQASEQGEPFLGWGPFLLIVQPPHEARLFFFFFVMMLCGMKMREYGNVMVFEVNMYYKINLDEDLPIPLIRRGDWRLIFNCKSNYMEQIASDI